MKAFLISGKAFSGKDTFGLMLKRKLEDKGARVLLVHFADYLKFIAEKYYGWNGKKDEAGRSLLQYIGTDVIRKKDENFLVNIVEELLTVMDGEFGFAIIPDTRFQNEVEFLEDFGHDVTTIRLNRVDYESPLTLEQQMHPSETDLDCYIFDYVFDCESGVENVQNAVDIFFEDFDGQDY